jgi:acetoin utilization deacetylase AcuC-like enzyme
MRAYYSDTFVLPLPLDHRFPMAKYARLRERLLSDGILRPEDLYLPDAASDEQLLRAHTADYVHRATHGLLTEKEMRRIGFPWSPAMIERSRRSSGATIAACRAAFEDGVSANLAGGTHHAFPDHGAGYCVFNDAAVAARAMQAERRARRVVILDCDVHQGDGTAAIFAGDTSVFTFSVHGAKNFPFFKQQSSLDVELPDDTGDDAYLAAVEEGARRAIAAAGADIAVYLAGADPYEGDRLGRMKVSMAGLGERDRIIFRLCKEAGLPVAVAMAGGYAREIDDIVAIHAQTIRTAVGFTTGEK